MRTFLQKYILNMGRFMDILTRAPIRADEPVFVIRAQDRFAVPLLRHYYETYLEKSMEVPEGIKVKILSIIQAFVDYKDGNVVKTPVDRVSRIRDWTSTEENLKLNYLIGVMHYADVPHEEWEQAHKDMAAEVIRRKLTEQLFQLVHGPVEDGDVMSKSGRDMLLALSLATRCCYRGQQGYTTGTYTGFSVAKLISEGVVQ